MESAALGRLRNQLTAERENLVVQLKDMGVNPQTGAPEQDQFGHGFADSAQATAEKAGVLAMAEQLVDTLHEVDAALERMDEGTYGRCEICGGQIPFERLEARPFARSCVKCASRR